MSWLVAGIVEVVKWLANEAATIGLVVWQVIKIIGGAILDVAGVVGRTFVRVWGFFGKFWNSVLRPFVTWSWQQIQKLHAWLKDTLGPVLKFLNAVREDILRIYDKWLKPIFVTLDVLRSITRLLAEFHVPFAQKIDDKLSALETRLLRPIRFALEKVNEAIGWIDRIVTFDGLFQRLTLIESQWRYVGDMWNVLLKHQPAGVSFAENERRRQQPGHQITAGELSKQLTEYYTTGGGDLAPDVAALSPVWTGLAGN